MKGAVGDMRHIKKSDQSYREADQIIRLVRYRFVSEYKWSWEDFDSSFEGRNLNLSTKELKSYSSKTSDKRKEEMLKGFVREYTRDLGDIIYRMEYSTTDPTSEH